MRTQADPLKAFARSRYAQRVADALLQADTQNDFAKVADLPIEAQSTYRQIAEAAVQMVCDRELREAAEYCAAAAYQQEISGTPFELMPLGRRHHHVLSIKAVIRTFLGFLRGEHPSDLEHFLNLARMDKQEKRARQQARLVAVQGGKL
jgi:hypothetical protein